MPVVHTYVLDATDRSYRTDELFTGLVKAVVPYPVEVDLRPAVVRHPAGGSAARRSGRMAAVRVQVRVRPVGGQGRWGLALTGFGGGRSKGACAIRRRPAGPPGRSAGRAR